MNTKNTNSTNQLLQKIATEHGFYSSVINNQFYIELDYSDGSHSIETASSVKELLQINVKLPSEQRYVQDLVFYGEKVTSIVYSIPQQVIDACQTIFEHNLQYAGEVLVRVNIAVETDHYSLTYHIMVNIYELAIYDYEPEIIEDILLKKSKELLKDVRKDAKEL